MPDFDESRWLRWVTPVTVDDVIGTDDVICVGRNETGVEFGFKPYTLYDS